MDWYWSLRCGLSQSDWSDLDIRVVTLTKGAGDSDASVIIKLSEVTRQCSASSFLQHCCLNGKQIQSENLFCKEIRPSQVKWSKLASCGNNSSWEVTSECLSRREKSVLSGEDWGNLAGSVRLTKQQTVRLYLPCLGWCHRALAADVKMRIRV